MNINNIKKVFTGSGGSGNLIFLLRTGKVYKLIPYFRAPVGCKRRTGDQDEIVFYKLLTDKIVLERLSPHIVQLYSYERRKNINEIIPLKCQISLEEKLFREHPLKVSRKQSEICNFKNLLDKSIISKRYDLLELEYCPITLSDKLKQLSKQSVNTILLFLERIIFQVVYTLSWIYDQFPTFKHNDFFVRNIIGIEETGHDENDFIEYNYKGEKFYFLANGYMIKINDFGMSFLKERNLPRSHDLVFPQRLLNQDHHSDIHNFLHDLYDGQDLGTTSLKRLVAKSRFKIIKDYIDQFINTDLIDHFNKHNRVLYNSLWSLSGHKLIRERLSVLTPEKYLSLFKNYQILPQESRSIMTFGSE